MAPKAGYFHCAAGGTRLTLFPYQLQAHPWLTFRLGRRPILSHSIAMVLRDLIGDVFRTLWAHKLRTFLTMFGIAWESFLSC
jgi:hypothetical protein